jgi:DNA-binding transcriptional LysR family regulator
MNLQHLKHFVAVAEELHFGRAAERIGMAQPPLSQSIRRLEDSLGCRLFIRSRRQVSLTSAGETLLEHAREILHQVEYVQKAIRRANDIGLTQVTIGCTPNAPDPVPTAMAKLRELAPGVEVKLWEGPTPDQVDGLLTGKLDLAFIHPMTDQIRGLEVRVIERNVPVAAIPADWPLAQRRELRMADLDDQPLLMFPPHVGPEYHAAILAAFLTAGVTPRITQEAAYGATRLRLVATGMGLSLVGGPTSRSGYPGVAFRPIVDLPDSVASQLCIAWRRGLSPAVRKLFMATYEKVRSPQLQVPAPTLATAAAA